jgi:hypothetical protein
MSRLRALSILLVATLAACGGSAVTPTSPATQAAIATGAAPTAAPPTATLAPLVTAHPTPLPGCLRTCVQPNLTSPGAMQAGPYETRYFFGSQLVVTLPDATWSSNEDSTGEFELHRDEHAQLAFWLDIYPIKDPGTTPIPGFDGTAAALLDWLAANPNVKVIERKPAKIGRLSGERIDFGSSPTAKNVDPGCPPFAMPCVGLFGFQQWDGFFGSGGQFKNRLYAADVMWDGTRHAVYAMISTDSAAFFDAIEPAAAAIIEGAGIPVDVQQ